MYDHRSGHHPWLQPGIQIFFFLENGNLGDKGYEKYSVGPTVSDLSEGITQ